MVADGTGVVLADRYELEDLIGRGGMADVYRALDAVLEREVAVKVLRTHAESDSDRDRFRDEAKLLASLDHPGLVSVLDAGLSGDDTPYLVMDLVDGRSLATLCRRGPVPPHRVARVGADLAAVLRYVHERGIVHRDIKPSNILVGRDGIVRLADFGIARMLEGGSAHTGTGATIGTAAYIAPEQVRGEGVSPASDVYSLGLVLLEALTGVRAYTGAPMEAALARLHAAPLIPTSLPTGWPTLLAQMTDIDPANRPGAGQAETALRSLDSSARSHRPRRRTDTYPDAPYPSRHSDQAPAPGTDVEPPDREVRRPRRTPVLVAAVAAVLATAGGGLLAVSRATSADPAGEVPAQVRPDLREPLQDLHDAVDR